jgi:hypothetical protein
MLLLALDTSTTAITAALHDGIQVLAEATTLDARAHGERLAPGIREVLTRAGAMPHDLTDVVVGLGPGLDGSAARFGARESEHGIPGPVDLLAAGIGSDHQLDTHRKPVAGGIREGVE